MTKTLKRCSKCGKYTIIHENCSNCGGNLENVHPAPFSLEDKYQEYRMDYFRKKMQKIYPELTNE